MKRLLAVILALGMLIMPVLSCAETTQETLEGIYKGDQLGFYTGWYKDINGTKPFDFNTKISGNVSIYAKWIKN